MRKSLYAKTEWLQKIIKSGNHSGCLRVTHPQDHSITWELYFQGNKLYYATSKTGQKDRLVCLWNYYIRDFSPPTSLFGVADYEKITHWWQLKQLPFSQLKHLIFQLSEEALAQVLAIDKPIIEFLPDHQIISPMTHFSWETILESANIRSQAWQQLSINSITPFNRLYLNPDKTCKFYQFWREQKKSKQHQIPRISFWLLNFAQKKCIYELAKERGILPLTFLEDFHELLQENIIEILPFTENNDDSLNYQSQLSSIKTKKKSSSPPLIACIDDSRTVQKHIQRTLEFAGYKTLSLTDPTLCLATLGRYQPVLILMDINMPQISGYELCQILQKSSKLRDIPIIMLTGREGIIDRVRAKLIGVDHYLTKPCDPKELIEVIQHLALQKSANTPMQTNTNYTLIKN
ncbi:response regulator [Crocosphaera sp. UHCC 0190]|uniref:response regulator n=1 Tax=Crocosphaera sp. UHCC 0190 TaxID=3110246 RepID=UPI002B1F988F|nr:response regulator [Crocosphaera sp. UHCC 0190]MEA5508707.1 response regulator [Crocosphaera sp. UHCC 0190]